MTATAPPLSICSFGYLHGPAPAATVVVDLRAILHDPDIDPALREKTAQDPTVAERVFATPGATQILSHLLDLSLTLIELSERSGTPVSIALGCAGGRHRSAALAAALEAKLTELGWPATVEHLHLHLPVVAR